MAKILCVDDEPDALEAVRVALERAGHQAVGVCRVEAALNVLGRGGIDLVVSDFQMPEIDGLEFLDILHEQELEVPFVLMTGHGSIEHAVTAMKKGAVDYITKPVGSREVNLAVEKALELVRLRRENARFREEERARRSQRRIVGESQALKRIMDTISAVAPSRATVLIQGDSGTGKELLARAVHDLSDRADGPFVSLNCAALPESLVESLLFGHEKGAFTGAVSRRKGAFERADGGTLLLDEISEMRLDLQAKLLRVLQEQEFERLGANEPTKVDVRVVATTNRHLEEAAREGHFREDLYYRLAVVPIQVPPLRERREDIPALAHHFARKAAAEAGKTIDGIAPEALERLSEARWTGNIRELAHTVERAVLLTRNTILQPEDFDRERFGLSPKPEEPGRSRGGDTGSGSDAAQGGRVRVTLDTLDLKEVEEVLIRKALEETGGNRTRAADLLGISVRTLRSKLND